MRVLSQMRRQLQQMRGRLARRRAASPPATPQLDQEHLEQTLGKLSDAQLCQRMSKLLAFYGLREQE